MAEQGMAFQTLEICDLHVSIEETGHSPGVRKPAEPGLKEILKGVNITIKRGEIHALMGPNGSGKSSLSYALMGHPDYKVTQGDIRLDGESLLRMTADERARRGLFLAMQYPVTVPGVTLYSFLHAATSAVRGYGEKVSKEGRGRLNAHLMPMREFRQEVDKNLELLNMNPTFLRRYLNEGFSGGEKKRAEILQMALLKPQFAILDETDSGLDIDALRVVAHSINQLQKALTMGLLLITHYQRILNYIRPHFVHVFSEGRIVKSGDAGLGEILEERGYDWVRQET